MIRSKYYPLIIAGLLSSAAVFAKTPFGMAGCGLGSIVMGSDGNQVFASTTNGTFESQLFGITSGTSNCLEPSKQAALSAQQKFMAENYSILSKEMSQGDGETLKAFSNTFGCKKEVFDHFASLMQSSYSQIFIAPGSMAALDVVQSQIKNNPQLASGCSLVI
ncbi:DUF3015 family protein [Silvanigrella aquatica]|uniref:DUF3015 domain-containing protein n=1 Tax=Silvanigrella aquatica TaxID=1915309 RepID=A0A1L4CWV9_9BACT|nr:DUF3015 family protein [Silvanigrella aquatica]APJ02432.1 hypothetical protein AXG55_00155 [Silvanigrella aquatica]